MPQTRWDEESASKNRTDKIAVHGGPQARSLALALQDFVEGIRRYEFWHSLAWNDVKSPFRRSWLGEFWMVINLAIFVVAVGTIYSVLLNMPLADYLPH